jgi:hypothetical protein
MTKFSILKRDKNPRGGLNSSGRARYNRATGGNLRPPVKSRPDTLTEYRRKGSFLVRMGSSQGRLFDAKGRKTRLKLSLEAWGYKGKSKSEAVALGRRYLRAYQNKKK